jgi:hypothetical protein
MAGLGKGHGASGLCKDAPTYISAPDPQQIKNEVMEEMRLKSATNTPLRSALLAAKELGALGDFDAFGMEIRPSRTS